MKNNDVDEILKLLDKYNYIYTKQLELLIGSNTNKVLKLLKARRLVKVDEQNIVCLNGVCYIDKNEKLLKMLWVLCDIKSKIIDHYPTDKHSITTIGAKENIEIIYCECGNEDVIEALFYEKYNSKIIIVEKVDQVKYIKVPNIKSFVLLETDKRKYFKLN